LGQPCRGEAAGSPLLTKVASRTRPSWWTWRPSCPWCLNPAAWRPHQASPD